jgi:predicted transcriptional regulator
MSATMSIHKLRMKAKQDRGQACLEYMQTRTTPVTLKELASKLGMTTKSISNSLMPLLEQGIIERELMLRQSSICKKSGWAYGYYITERKDKVKKAKAPKFQYHDPFNIRGIHAT